MQRRPRTTLLQVLSVLAAVGMIGSAESLGDSRRVSGTSRPTRLASAEELRASLEGGNIVLCVIDAARADHVGYYGYPRETTPNIDRLAAESLVFDNHFVQFPETKPSTATLFTSLYPDTHLAYGSRWPPESAFTLAQGLRSAGFHTVLFSQNGYASPMWGIGNHFHEAYYEPHLKEAGRDLPQIWKPEALLELVSGWLAEGNRQRFFAYVHFMPPHSPALGPREMKYRFQGEKPPNAWRSDYPFAEVERELRANERPWSEQQLINLYDGNMLYADWAVGELEGVLDEAGLLDKTLLIITSDHGEAFGEHGYRGHTLSAYDESIHVPLLMKLPGPGAPRGRVAGLTQAIDILPTLLDLLEVSYPESEVQGRSLLPLMSGEVKEVNPFVFARAEGRPPSYIVRDHRSMLLLYRGGSLRALYDLEVDPRQITNVIVEQPERAAELAEAFRTFAGSQVAPPLEFVDPDAPPARLPDAPEVEVTDEMRRSLRALGYIK